MPTALDRIFENSYSMALKSTPSRIVRPQDIEAERAGHRALGSQPDNTISVGRITLDPHEPIDLRFRDELLEFKDPFDALAQEARPSQFPMKIIAKQEYADGLFEYAFREQTPVRSGGVWVWQNKTNGRSSFSGINQFGFPAYSSIEISGLTSEDNEGMVVGLVFEGHEERIGGFRFFWFEGTGTSVSQNDMLGVITARSGTLNATYTVQAAHDSSIVFTNVTPCNRIAIANTEVDWIAADVGKKAIILEDQPPEIAIFERGTNKPC